MIDNMSANLPTCIKRYCSHARRLQAILDETKRCFEDINKSGKNENGKSSLFLLTKTVYLRLTLTDSRLSAYNDIDYSPWSMAKYCLMFRVFFVEKLNRFF